MSSLLLNFRELVKRSTSKKKDHRNEKTNKYLDTGGYIEIHNYSVPQGYSLTNKRAQQPLLYSFSLSEDRCLKKFLIWSWWYLTGNFGLQLKVAFISRISIHWLIFQQLYWTEQFWEKKKKNEFSFKLSPWKKKKKKAT